MLLFDHDVVTAITNLTKEDWKASTTQRDNHYQMGQDLTTGNDRSMTLPQQPNLCEPQASKKLNFISLVLYFRDLSPEPALECEEELSPSPDQRASRPTSRATSTPPPTLTPHRPSPLSPSPPSSPGLTANQPKGADGSSKD